ncbi:MAG: sugar-binding transcriptional regulator [Christensenellaceae bacterium]
MALSEEEKYYIKLKASYLYYIEDKTQSEIAKLFNVSRPTLIKLLNDAKDEGIVKIEIQDIRRANAFIELEQKLRKKLNLHDVKIVSVNFNDKQATLNNIGAAAAQYLSSIIKSGMILGISWGKTLEAMSRYVRHQPNISDIYMIPLLGGPGNTNGNKMYANSLCEIISSNYTNCSVGSIYAPLIAPNRIVAKAFMESDSMREIFNKMENLDIAMVGIDGDPHHSTTSEMEISIPNFVKKLEEAHIVGNICSRFFDIDGNILNSDFVHDTIAISVENLRTTPIVIGVAGGIHKVDSIIGGARAKLYNVLVTDENTARKILKTI